MHGCLITKELKKHSSKLVVGAERAAGMERRGAARQQLADCMGGHTFMPRQAERNSGEARPQNPEFQHGKLKTQNPGCKKSVGDVAVRETPGLTGEFTIHLWEGREVMECGTRADQAALFPL